jgi:hypothetical protein
VACGRSYHLRPPRFSGGQKFELSSPDPAAITNVVLARPMAVTLQTDTEQKTLEMPYVPIGLSTFGTLDTSGAVTDRFGVGNEYVASAFAAEDLGYGPSLFCYLRRDAAGFPRSGRSQ